MAWHQRAILAPPPTGTQCTFLCEEGEGWCGHGISLIPATRTPCCNISLVLLCHVTLSRVESRYIRVFRLFTFPAFLSETRQYTQDFIVPSNFHHNLDTPNESRNHTPPPFSVLRVGVFFFFLFHYSNAVKFDHLDPRIDGGREKNSNPLRTGPEKP